MNSVERILHEDGPCLSSDLVKRLIESGLSAEAARQRVARAGPGVLRLKGLVFPRNTRFLYLEKQFGHEIYWRALIRDVTRASPAYGPAIAALQARGGVVPVEHFAIVSGSPIKQSGQVSSDTVLERLEAVKLVQRFDLDGIGPVVALHGNGYLGAPDVHRLKARLLVEKLLILAVRDWARKLGVASYDKIAVRGDGELPRFGTFHWDVCGPSYMVPIVRREKDGTPKPGFMVCDAICDDVVNEQAVAAFVRKYRLCTALKNLPPFLPILIADGFTREGFRFGRSHGLMMATPGTLFGREIAVGLATLLDTLSKAAAVAVHRPEVVGELFSKLGSIEGAAGNLRGALFELMVGHVVKACYGGSIDIGEFVRHGEFSGEIDVLRVPETKELWLYECKGYQPDHVIGAAEIEHWLKDRLPGFYKAMKAEKRFNDREMHFEFWTSGRFSPEALALLEQAKAATKRYHIGWKDGPGVRKELAHLPSQGMAKIFDEHYRNHPIARFDRKYDGEKALSDLNLALPLGGHDGLADEAEVAEGKPPPTWEFAKIVGKNLLPADCEGIATKTDLGAGRSKSA